AKKLFGEADALGKSLKFDTLTYVVTGVLKDIPKLSHLRFEALVSFSTAEILLGKADPNFLSWENIWQNYVYLVLPEHANSRPLQASLDKLSATENAGIQH